MKNFGKFFMILSAFALCIGFTSCNDNVPDAEEVTISIKAGEATETSISFTVTSNGADSGVYWIYKAEEPIEFNISDGAIFAVNTNAEVVVDKLEPGTAYCVKAYAKNLVNEASSETISMQTLVEVPTPTVAVEINNETGVTATSVSFNLTLTNAEEAAWIINPMGNDLKANEIFTNGTKVTPTTSPETLTISKDQLTPNTNYDLWVVAKNGEKVCKPVLKTFTTKGE